MALLLARGSFGSMERFADDAVHRTTFHLSLVVSLSHHQEIVRKDWMFKLVGTEVFEIVSGQAKCEILINASFGFSYEYTLLVNGKQLKKFKEKQTKIQKTWMFKTEENREYRIVLGKYSNKRHLYQYII